MPIIRYGSTDEISQAALFLASMQASHAIGHTLAVAGLVQVVGRPVRDAIEGQPSFAPALR
jgi:NAD(P)-dependent dehydrogenase (short-subunit alcohol dehydrogenase family)